MAVSIYDPEQPYSRRRPQSAFNTLDPNNPTEPPLEAPPPPVSTNEPVERQPQATPTNPISTAATAANPRDPAWVDQFLAQMAQRQGVNPSVINDPGYWRQKMLSGELGSDVNYITQRMMQAEGAPAGSAGGSDFSSFLSSIFGSGQGPMPTQISGLSSVSAPGGMSTGGIQDAYRSALMQMLQTPTTVDAASLNAGPEAAGYRIGSQRGAERARREVAAQAEREGWAGSGAFDTKVRGIGQQRAEGEAQFLGTLANQKLQQQRELLVKGVEIAQNMGQFEQAQQMQAQLANLDAALKRESLGQSGQQFFADLALRRELGLGGLGYNYAALQQAANRDATMALLGNGSGG